MLYAPPVEKLREEFHQVEVADSQITNAAVVGNLNREFGHSAPAAISDSSLPNQEPISSWCLIPMYHEHTLESACETPLVQNAR